MRWSQALPPLPAAAAHGTTLIRAMQDNKTVTECAKEVEECQGLRNAYSACKRGQLDARSRLRGNKGY
jgi:hypothetical protein